MGEDEADSAIRMAQDIKKCGLVAVWPDKEGTRTIPVMVDNRVRIIKVGEASVVP